MTEQQSGHEQLGRYLAESRSQCQVPQGEPQNPRLPGAHGSASGACSQVLISETRYGIELVLTGFKQREIPVNFLEAPELL